MSEVAYTEYKYLCELAKSYPTRDAVYNEIINLNAILNLPKGTEHFMSDIHGEYEAFSHIRRNASGVIRRKVDMLYSDTLSEGERAELATLIYYPEEKLDEVREHAEEGWYRVTIGRLIEICRLVSEKYTRSKVRRRLSKSADGYDYIIDELINSRDDGVNKKQYTENVLKTIVRLGASERFIVAISSAIKCLVIDRLHIVGDIFDRGARADIVADQLMRETSIDIQWGNHDVLWLGAAAGSRTCIATVINNSMTYKNLDVIEIGYGISLRPLAMLAEEVYGGADVSAFMPKGNYGGDLLGGDDDLSVARMHKAISIIQFKLEGQTIMRNPEFCMEDRLLLDKIDRTSGTVKIGERSFRLRECDFPTVNPDDPYALTEREREVMAYLKNAFMRSEKLSRHANFLFEKGGMYKVYNRNLLFHGCIPLNDDGSLMSMPLAEGRCGRALMDYCDKVARQGYFAKEGSKMRQRGKDFLWFLWCGKDSPLCARKKIATFERLLVDDPKAWVEPKNYYYHAWGDEKIADMILAEFGLGGVGSHIINGHIPIKAGDNPIKAGGKLIVIDGGFCSAYRKTTGIGGYTLIYNADGIRISAHEAFSGKENAIRNNMDILSDTVVFEQKNDKIRVRETDNGAQIREKIADLMQLLKEYESGSIKEVRG